MSDRNKVTELLKNYRYYKQAIRGFENQTSDEKPSDENMVMAYMVASPCRTTLYSETPVGRGSGSRRPTLSGMWGRADIEEYHALSRAVRAVEDALDALKADERRVIELKWLHGMTLEAIEREYHYGTDYAKKIHQRAIRHLEICLRFVEVPQVRGEKVPVNA